MLGVLKRRWKPKRANNNNNKLSGKLVLDPEPPPDKKNPTSPRQIHPVCEEKLQLGYEEQRERVTETLTHPGGAPPYPLVPNICVEGGRIEFIKASLGGSTSEFSKAPLDCSTGQPPSPPHEKADIAKECLEARIKELEEALEAERRITQKEKLQNAKLQRQLARREVLQRDVDRERRLRLDSECRLRNSATEADKCRVRLAALQREFSRMEETVRAMLQYKARYDQLKQDKHQLTAAYENRVQQFQNALSKLNQENEALKKQLHALEAAGAGEVVLERLRRLELENGSLTLEGERQRKQYERCLDDVANQVVRALLSQKGLREEIGSLHQRVRELETQNRTLTSLLLQQLSSVTSSGDQARLKPSFKLALPAPGCEARRVWEESVVWLPLQRPLTQRPATLSLDACCRRLPSIRQPAGNKEEDEGSGSPESGNRDEGYSTMSSDVQGLAEAPCRLEGLKEATDETETAALPLDTVSSSPDRLPEPDLVLIPLSLALGVSSPANRHSFPPVRDLLPYQHVMRSFSDSHLCLKLTQSTTAPSSYSLASAESVVFHKPRDDEDSGSWCSGDWWDADYVQHWLRLDETRSALQQQMEYDAAELEDWSMEEEVWRREPLTHSQTLPSIQESISAELEEDSNEHLWNSSYLVDQLTVPSYNNHRLISPGGDSWSSASENDCVVNASSKRSSAALSTDSGDSPAVGTDFTRDFYRLVKFESTKSLASTSSRGESRRSEIPSLEREQALQSVLHFIAEQQHYVMSREMSVPCEVSLLEETSPEETSQEFTQICEDVKRLSSDENVAQNSPNRRPLSSETLLNEYNSLNKSEDRKCSQTSKHSIVSGSEAANSLRSCQKASECQNVIKVPLDKLDTEPKEYVPDKIKSPTESVADSSGRSLRVDCSRSLRPVPEEDEDHPNMSESLTSTVSTPETVQKVQSLSSSVDSVLVNGAKTLNFHERATSKDVIEELNRMIRKGEESTSICEVETTNSTTNLDSASCCCPTGWVHVERDIDFTDPKARANLLDVMLAASHSSSSSGTNSSSSSRSSLANHSDSGDNEDTQDYQHLHRLHRSRRHKKVCATREALGALRCSSMVPRPSIIGRDDFYVRYGAKEQEAVASFDFLEDLSTTSVSGASSSDHKDDFLAASEQNPVEHQPQPRRVTSEPCLDVH